MRPLLLALLFVAACSKPAAPPSESAAAPGEAQQAAPSETDLLAAVDTVNIEPLEPLTGQSLMARVVDPQNRALTFTWLVDGTAVAGQSRDRLEGEYVKKGASIEVRVVPVTEKGEGEAKSSAAVKVGNSPPRMDAIDFISSENNTVVMQARAGDPDGDKLTYRIVSGPQGMNVDADGKVSWTLPANFAAPVSFVVGASDGVQEASLQGDIGQR